jgi:ribonuclease HII
MSNYILSNSTTAGVDEVGRGTLFGNVVASCVILPETFKDSMYLQIKDSKKLSFKKRSILAEYIKENAIAYGIGYVTPDVIDKINILRASIEAMHKAIYEVMKKTKVEKLIIDGTQFTPILPLNDEDEIISYECIPKADNLYLNVAAASIIAKDYHDKEILKLLDEYPELEKYDLRNNMGYATVKHRNAIDTYGLHEFHRKSFRTCHNFIQKGI